MLQISTQANIQPRSHGFASFWNGGEFGYRCADFSRV
jgi:hypothetical protein